MQLKAIRRLAGAQLALMMLAFGILSLPLSGQSAQDSVPVWTAWIRTGTAAQKTEAVDRLGDLTPNAITVDAQAALIAELNRIHDAFARSVDPEILGGGDDHSDFYINLVLLVANVRTEPAARALVSAIGVSAGVQRRVARWGDIVVPGLVQLLQKGESEVDALETLGFVWFWADSTGSTLSTASRHQILTAFVARSQVDTGVTLLGLASALEAARSPIFVGLVDELAVTAGRAGQFGSFVLRNVLNPLRSVLHAVVDARSNLALLSDAEVAHATTCFGVNSGPRHGLCQSVGNRLASAREHFAAGRQGPAREVLQGALRAYQSARDASALSAAEFAILSGELSILLARSW